MIGLLYFGFLALLVSAATLIGIAVWIWRGTREMQNTEARWVFRVQLLVVSIAFAALYGMVFAQIIRVMGEKI